jgi:hypothetical protein
VVVGITAEEGPCNFGWVVDSRRSYSVGIGFIVRIGLDLVEGLDGAEYFLPFSFFDPTQKKPTSTVTKPSATATISHTPSSSPSRSSSSHPQSEPSRRTAVTTHHYSPTTSQAHKIEAALVVVIGYR